MYEPGLEDLGREALATGRLTFTTNISAARDADVHFICVGAPQKSGKYAADTSSVFEAVPR